MQLNESKIESPETNSLNFDHLDKLGSKQQTKMDDEQLALMNRILGLIEDKNQLDLLRPAVEKVVHQLQKEKLPTSEKKAP